MKNSHPSLKTPLWAILLSALLLGACSAPVGNGDGMPVSEQMPPDDMSMGGKLGAGASNNGGSDSGTGGATGATGGASGSTGGSDSGNEGALCDEDGVCSNEIDPESVWALDIFEITFQETREDGMSWDDAGGLPDIRVCVSNRITSDLYGCNAVCTNSLVCNPEETFEVPGRGLIDGLIFSILDVDDIGYDVGTNYHLMLSNDVSNYPYDEAKSFQTDGGAESLVYSLEFLK